MRQLVCISGSIELDKWTFTIGRHNHKTKIVISEGFSDFFDYSIIEILSQKLFLF